MSRVEMNIKTPMLTVEQVRRRFGDPQPTKHTGRRCFTGAITKLEKAVRRTSISDQQTEELSFNDLPYGIKRKIFEMVQSSPGWVHITLEDGQLVAFDGSSREVYINREWYQSHVFRQGLIRSDQFGLFKRSFLNLNPLRRVKPSVNRFSILMNEKNMISSVKMSSDWVFFDGKGITDFQDPGGALPYSMADTRYAVFRMEDLFERINRTEDGEEGADFVLARGSRVEDLVIVLGELRKDVKPDKMGVIRAYRVENVNKEMGKLAEIYPAGEGYSPSENYMMGDITKAWSRTIVRRRQRQHAWLESPDGRQWLSYPFHDKTNTISRWLATEEGHKWLDSKGSEFLASESGWWWLASALGHPWLESQQGLQWLDTEGLWFLKSPQALLWADIGAPSDKFQKTWSTTSAGMAWAFKNCPEGVPPKLPRQPTGKLPRNLFVDQSFGNINFRGWSFVRCRYEDTA
ncbi:uncharacterized protein GGS22DRAFT_169811 [Annulohypoxylon maeteangense]|uniref:uncharacterized protein n=1 Tax=Annulohypoxylon maeteangense TaxID=1927788 RepID=UPI002008E2A2|nr:uncharacterized protein GGS22DRAFT_169811 [Annulohypoxylon maeteangense]KAI0882592.1 hypothetical protein GGS22DRAFT_169811 [Annulohypoxylon maeteangense]